MRLNKLDQFKEFIGKEVICIPTGNAARDRDTDYYETKKVCSVGRKYIKLISRGGEDNYRVEDGATQSEISRGYGSNSGFMFFPSLATWETYRDHKNISTEVSRTSRYFDWESLSGEDLKVVYNILKKKIK